MKLLGKTKDRAIGNLLRAYGSRPANPHQACTDFDPDLASAYVEGRLTPPTRTRYETHLSECAGCRKGAVTLARMAHAESVASPAYVGRKETASRLASPGGIFRALSAPRWAMAAAGVVVLAISLPLLLTRNSALENAPKAVAQDQTVESARPGTAPVNGPMAAGTSGELASNKVASSDSREGDKRAAEISTANGDLTAKKAPEPREEQPVSAEPGKPQIQAFDQVQAKTESQVSSQAPAQPVQSPAETQQAKSDSDRGRQQEKDVAQAPEPKPTPADDGRADKEKAGKAEQVAPPPAAPESSRVAESSRSLGRSRAKLGLRDSSANEAVPPRTAGREIRGKKFFLKEGTWTDKDYNPDKDLPTITLIRDSNVYKEVLTRRSSLKPFLDQFSESERAIIVYKGTVYKLIPQKNDN